jgi:hypothetical protein
VILGFRFGGESGDFVVAGVLWLLFMAVFGIGLVVTRKRNVKFAARLQAAGFLPVTDENGRTRYLPPGAQLPGQGNPFAGGPYGQQAPGPYGQQAPGPYAQQAPGPYVQQAPGSYAPPAPYGGQPAPGPYGGQSAAGPHPGRPAPGPYQGRPAPGPYQGQPAPGPYGTQPPGPYGQPYNQPHPQQQNPHWQPPQH